MLTIVNSGVPARRPESKFERARIDRARSNLFAASRPLVVEMRFSFLLTLAAVTPSKGMQFHSFRGQLFAYERKIHSDPLCHSYPCATSDTRRRCGKSANWREVYLIYGTHVLCAYMRESRDYTVYLKTSSCLEWFFLRMQVYVFREGWIQISMLNLNRKQWTDA